MQVNPRPFRVVGDVELLFKSQAKRALPQPPSEGIHKQCGDGSHAGKNQLAQLCRCPAYRIYPSPGSTNQSSGGEQEEQDQSQRPGSMSIRPQTKEQRNYQKRRISALAERVQDGQ